MRRRELVRRLEEIGCVLVRHGAKHDWYQNPETKMAQPVPRHAEIKEPLAKHILKLLRDRPSERP
jgi:predicted RNA binding protein YcfA (HicA-like mRNA interferase family)